MVCHYAVFTMASGSSLTTALMKYVPAIQRHLATGQWSLQSPKTSIVLRCQHSDRQSMLRCRDHQLSYVRLFAGLTIPCFRRRQSRGCTMCATMCAQSGFRETKHI